jgi:hypothetical protein
MTKKLSSRSALALLLLQVAACGSTPPKKLIRPSEDAGSDQGGASSDAGATSSAGAAGGSGKGGAPPSGGSGPDNAGTAGVGASGGDAGATEVGGGSGVTGGTGGASTTGGSGGNSATGGTGGTGGTSTSGGAGAGGGAGAPPTCTPLPSSVITTSATAVHGDKGVAATVPTQTGVSYAWSVVSGPATISGSATQNTVTFDVGATGTEIVLQAIVTSTATACASTSTVHVPIPCAPPTLISLDHSQAAAVPQYIPGNEDSGRFDLSGSSNLWVPYLATKTATASYNATFDHFSAGTWGVPASSPAILNDPSARVLFYKVATDNAGDAVFVWTQTTDNNNYSVMVAAYHVGAPTPWTTPQLVGTVFNQGTPVAVQIDRSTGLALIAWSQGPFGSIIPHLRTYAVSSNTLGTDTALRATTTNNAAGDEMALALETNDALTGFAAWYERISSTSLSTLYALHITNGVPDTVASAYDIQALAVGTKTFTTDVFNFNSVHNVASSNEPRMIAVSAGGNAAVVWPVYNGLATGTLFGGLYARRYTAGAWSAAELVATQGPSFYAPDWAIDDAGNVITVTQTNNVGFDFFAGVKGSAWSTAQRLANVNGSLAAPHIAVDAGTGKGVVTYRDQSLASRAPLRGTFYDPTSHALSPAFTIDDPQQSGGEAGRVRIDSTGLATVVFSQQPSVLPVGANSSNSSLLFSTICK